MRGGCGMNEKRTLQLLLSGSANVRFRDLLALAEKFGFRLVRTSGSHHILTHPDVPGLLNLQNVKGQAKHYQIRQFLKLIETHDLKLGDEE